MSAQIQIVKSVPIIADVDVLVAGGGIAGATAAVTAAKEGAETMLVDRFGRLGGNMGPGMMSGGITLTYIHPKAMSHGLTGTPGEFIARCETYLNAPLLMDHYFRDSQIISYVWSQMMQESGVQLLLNTFVTDPIMEGDRVAGLVVENKSGAQAIRAKVVIDATGDADVAARAGAPVDDGRRYSHPGMYFAMDNVDVEEYQARVVHSEPDPEDVRWAKEMFEEQVGHIRSWAWSFNNLKPLIPYIRPAWESGEYRSIQAIGDIGRVLVDHGLYGGPSPAPNPIPGREKYGIIGAQIGVWGTEVLSGDAAMMTRLEVGARDFIFETAQFLQRRVPGFENAYLHVIAPYFHSRGGRSAVSQHPLTMDGVRAGRRLDDVVFLANDTENKIRIEEGFDFPYRQLLPKEVEGLLVTGRAAIIQPPVTRTRWKVFLMGQAAGAAAALAAKGDVTPGKVDVKELQRLLYHKYGAPLGDVDRLRELGLV